MSSIKTDLSVLPLFVVDAFTKKPFEGNSAAVCLLPFHEMISKDIKQKIAAEMQLSETAFITTKSEEDTFEDGSSFQLEWFTPTCEVSLCGHATLASAAVLFMIFNNKSAVLEFETASGILETKLIDKNRIQIDLPAYNSTLVDEKYNDLVKAVVGSLPVKNVALSDSMKILIRLSDKVTKKELEAIRTKDDKLISAAPDVRGVIVTLKGSGLEDCKDEEGNNYDFISRYFTPWLGISEDPVTGAAHSVLAPYWAKALNKNKLYARQCSTRGGNLYLELVEDRIHISGNAVIVIQGQINF